MPKIVAKKACQRIRHFTAEQLSRVRRQGERGGGKKRGRGRGGGRGKGGLSGFPEREPTHLPLHPRAAVQVEKGGGLELGGRSKDEDSFTLTTTHLSHTRAAKARRLTPDVLPLRPRPQASPLPSPHSPPLPFLALTHLPFLALTPLLSPHPHRPSSLFAAALVVCLLKALRPCSGGATEDRAAGDSSQGPAAASTGKSIQQLWL